LAEIFIEIILDEEIRVAILAGAEEKSFFTEIDSIGMVINKEDGLKFFTHC